MDEIGPSVRQRVEQIVVENEMLRAGFSALPYAVLRDSHLSPGARVAYAVLLMYAWQEGSCFPGQKRMAADMGVSERHLRRFLRELGDRGYISIKRQGLNRPNIYYILDVKTKLKGGGHQGGPDTDVRSGADTDVRSRPDTQFRSRADTDVPLIDSSDRPKE